MSIVPFPIRVPEAELTELRERIARTRWPESATEPGWTQGVPVEWLQRVARHWSERYDWRRIEQRINSAGSFRAEVDGLGIHVLHLVPESPHPLPIVLTHGWPGGVIEYLPVAERLRDDGFEVVLPSLPGYGFSDKPSEQGWGVDRVAGAWVTLLGDLGHDRFVAAGSDWGTSVSTRIGQLFPGPVAGIHLVPPLAPVDPGEHPTDAERAAARDLAERARSGDGYTGVHATKPQTLGYALTDSPTGLAAWILEKLVEWSDGDPEETIGLDAMLDLVTLYWLTASAASSARLYRESIAEVQAVFRGDAAQVDVPTAATVFPTEVPRPSRRQVERRFRDLRFWSEPERGGHFGALEQPDRLAADIAAFARML